MATSDDSVTFLVLCGGMGSRMRGQDKPLITYQGKPMVDHVIASAPGLPLLISANRNLDAYGERGPVFTDREVDSPISSPLTGVLGGLERCETPWLLVAPGDSPALPIDWWQPLAKEVDGESPGVVTYDGRRQQNLHLLLNANLAPMLRKYLRDGRGEVWRFLKLANIARQEILHPEWFINVNEVEDLR